MPTSSIGWLSPHKHLVVPYTDEERQVHHSLQQYSTLRLKHAASDGERTAAEFVLKLLKKRLFSPPAAFGIKLEKHLSSVGGQKAAGTATRDIEDFSDEYADDEEYEAQTGEVVSSVSQTLSPISAEEKALLRELSEYAANTSQRPDCKAQTLIDWLTATLRRGGKWNNERVIIFTEYRATQKWLFDLLAREGFAEQGRLEMIYGGMPNYQREPIKAAFQANPNESAVRSRAIPYRLEKCGYVPVRNDAADSGLWVINGTRQVIYARSNLSIQDRFRAARRLTNAE